MSFKHIDADWRQGLTTKQVQERLDQGAYNHTNNKSTSSVGKIIFKNLVSPFNIINLILATAVFLVGSPRNALFLGVAIVNTLMGIFQELRAKSTLDKLSILAKGEVTAIRDSKQISIPQKDIVIDDILLLSTGNQMVVDAKVVHAESLEIDESLLTGESNSIPKKPGDTVLSGSFVIAGHAWVRVTAIAATSYAGKLSAEAKQMKKPTAPLMNTLNRIIKILTFVIIPLGGILFWRQFIGSDDLHRSVLGATAAMVGMIPEGLVLLTGITLTVGALKLARKKALVQSLPSIETLARVDTLCLDKTGTITDGTLVFEKISPSPGHTDAEISAALGEMMLAIGDKNGTAEILSKEFPSSRKWTADSTIPFSSQRKWSAASFKKAGSYVLGAPNFVFPDKPPKELSKSEEYLTRGQRVLVLAHTKEPLNSESKTLPRGLKLVGFVILSDHIRPEATKTFRYFKKEGVELKVISGDDARAVSVIAERVGIANAKQYVDMSNIPEDTDLQELATTHTVFGRVSPEQKKSLIAALKAAKHTVCMTGDGVNDVLALKEADCGVAMINGSDAARASADFVLMTSDFSAMIGVLKEGRRVINNIENVASLYLVKTIYSALLAILYIFIPHPYPFSPLQMTPINMFTVGIPSFFLALRPLYDKPKGRFLANVIENSAPAAVTIVLDILIIRAIGTIFNLSQSDISTMNVILTATIGFILLIKVARPIGWPEKAMITMLSIAFIGVLIGFDGFLGYTHIFSSNMLCYVPLMFASPLLFTAVSKRLTKIGKFG
ncbi:MAG: HAD-IC family P-type ATPase [Candidatus Nomurabacteria bacterium]|jgi:cation-transporting ATPase E|nr:HAD-IC family P-type ATPase [Candidatus Nomurabacteria bacterium]